MKQRLKLIPLLLALLLLLSACQGKNDPSTETQAPSQSTGSSAAPLEDSTLLGNWYCETAYMVFRVKGDGVFDYYPVLMDDYAYAEEIVTGSYTISGNTATFVIEESEMPLTYNAEKDCLTAESGITFTRTDVLPTKLTAANPADFKGIWYFDQAQVVFDLREDGTLDYYQIKAGYYTYSSKEALTYTVTDATIALTIGKTTLTLIYNKAKDSLVSTTGMNFIRKDVAPTEHPSYPFPNFAQMNCTSFVTLGAYRGLTSSTTTSAHAAIDIFNEYYKANPAKKPRAITEDRAARYGDVVVIDYTGYLNGVAFAGGAAVDQTVTIITNSGYIEGFAEGIVGHKMGTTFDVKVTFPKNYGSADLAGKEAVFTMTLDTIYDLTLTDGEIAAYTKDENATYSSMLADYTESYRIEDLTGQILAATTHQMPEEAYQYFHQYLMDTYHYYAFSYNYDYKVFLAAYGLTEDMLKKEAQDVAMGYIICQIIYEKEGLQYSQELYNEQLEVFIDDAMEYFKYTREEAKEFVLKNEIDNVNSILVQKTVHEWLLNNNQ